MTEAQEYEEWMKTAFELGKVADGVKQWIEDTVSFVIEDPEPGDEENNNTII